MKKHIIIVAGGKGLRMGGDIPKQFLPVCGKPVLMRTLEAFRTYDPSIHIVLVLPVSQQTYWKELCRTCRFELPHDIADGGETRFHSVMNGLALVEGDGLGVDLFVFPRGMQASFLQKDTECADVRREGIYFLRVFDL